MFTFLLLDLRNHCPVTRCAYLEAVTHLLQQPSSVEATLLIPLLEDVKKALGSSNEERLLEEDILVSSAHLLLTASQTVTLTTSLPQTSKLCRTYLLHQSSAVRQFTLQYILDQETLLSQDEGDHNLTTLIVQLFSTEADEALLILLCDILTKQNMECTKTQETLYAVALHHISQVHLR